MKQIKISVIIPIYNAEDTLKRCIESVLLQTYPAYEIILIDDGSTDRSGGICDRYLQTHPMQVKVLHQINRGAASARNAGIDRSKGDYLAFLDSDDYYESNMLQTMVGLIQKYNADMSIVEKWMEFPNGKGYCMESVDTEKCWDTKEALIWINSYRYIYPGFPVLMVSRNAFGELRFPEGERSEDYALQYQVIARCKRIAYCSRPLYHYVQTAESCSRTANICLAPMAISMEQLRFFQKYFPDIVFAAETGCAIEHMGIWSAYLRNGVQCPRPLLHTLRSVARRYLKSVLCNRYIPRVKKLQAIAFCYAPHVYKWIITRTKHR